MISILGTGTMGCGIALELSKYNFDVQLVITGEYTGKEEVENKLKNSMKRLEESEVSRIMEKITILNDLSMIGASQIIIEAITENLDAKRSLINKALPFISNDAVIATNTSSLSIRDIFNLIEDKSRVIGIHFFNPVKVMKLVEIITLDETSDNTKNIVKQFVNKLGKDEIFVKDSPGFVVNRLLIPMINEAARMVDEGIASIEDIDKAMMLGANHPIGPLKLADLIGNDITLAISKILLDNKTVSEGLTEMVAGGKLGKKSLKGYYNY